MIPAQLKKQVNTVKTGNKRVPMEHEYVAETTVFNVPIYVTSAGQRESLMQILAEHIKTPEKGARIMMS